MVHTYLSAYYGIPTTTLPADQPADALLVTKKKMEAIYTRFAPHKLCKVGGLLARYAGDEDKLLRIVRRKYVDTGTAAVVTNSVESNK